jgi:hypothetical protein
MHTSIKWKGSYKGYNISDESTHKYGEALCLFSFFPFELLSLSYAFIIRIWGIQQVHNIYLILLWYHVSSFHIMMIRRKIPP